MFIDFEGIDGSGKTTLSEMLLEKMQGLGLNVQHTRAKGKWKARLSGDIRAITRDPRNLSMSSLSELLLYTARDAQMVEEFIEPALADEVIVLADRYLYSYYSMCHYGRELDYEQVDRICQTASRGIWPDLILYIDVDLPTSRWRKRISKIMDRRLGDSGRKGMSGLGLRGRMRKGFLALAEKDTKRWIVIDNVHGSIAQVFDKVWAAVAPVLNSAGLLDTKHLPLEKADKDKDLGVVPPLAQMQQKANQITALTDNNEKLKAVEEHFYSLLERFSERWPGLAALLISRMDDKRDYVLRDRLLGKCPEQISFSLTGLTSDAAYTYRQKTAVIEPRYTALGLQRLTDKRAWELRERLKGTAPAEVALSLSYIDSSEADTLRTALFEQVPEAVLSGCAWVDSPATRKLREAFNSRANPEILAKSITGINTARAWELREKLLKNGAPWVLASISGIETDRAWELRQLYLDKAAKVILSGLDGMDHPLAWEMREDRLSWAKEALDSIKGMDSKHAFALRKKAAGFWDNTLVGSLEGIDSPEAEEMRWSLYKKNPENLLLIKHLVEAGRPLLQSEDF